MSAQGLHVAVVMGGPGREATISRKSGQAIASALEASGHQVTRIDCDGELDLAQLPAGVVVFNIIHGTYGEDGTLQRQLEEASIAYVGSDSAASALCMDKEKTKQRLAEADIPVPWGKSIDPRNVHDPEVLKVPHMGPLVLKPRADGSSVGLHLLPSASFLIPALEEVVRELGPIKLLLEERILGDEFTVGVLQRADGTLQVLPPLQIIPAGDDAYDFEAKYNRNDTAYVPVTDGPLQDRMKELAALTFEKCNCRDFARIDILTNKQDEVYVLEVNTLPGFTDHSLLPKSAELVGMPFIDLVDFLVRCAGQRQQAEVE